MISYTLKVKDLGKPEKRMARALKQETAKAASEVSKKIIDVLAAESVSIYDLGGYRSGWRASVFRDRLRVYNIKRNAVFVEKGRRAGAKQPPLEAIAPWVERHLGDRRLAFPVARSIAQKGIRPRPVLTSPRVQARLRKLWHGAMQKARDRALATSRTA